MTTVLCTLYNSLYLDKGLVLYDSLCECAKDFRLYVLCMDEKCYEVLTDLKQEHHIPVRLSDFEEGDEPLSTAKGNRSMGEYCWTCSSSFIRYVLRHYDEKCCTYIDCDMYFYNDPQILLDEMNDAGKSVMVVPHRFPKDKKSLAEKVGTFCVEFNTFLNTPESLDALEYWRNRCLDSCKNIGDGIHWGDQKYLDEIVKKFNCVHVCQNPGAGIASWNISQYNSVSPKNKGGNLYFKDNDTVIKPIFFHYAGLQYLKQNRIGINIYTLNKEIEYELVDYYYRDYLLKIDIIKKMLKGKYQLTMYIKKHPVSSVNFFKSYFTNSRLSVILKIIFHRPSQVIISI